MKTTPIQPVTREEFMPFGDVIAFPLGLKEDFHIVTSEPDQPWRLAVYRYQNKCIERMECHPDSKESFEPLEGQTILLVAAPETPEKSKAFLLDKPVCLHKGTWHQVLSLTESASVKITENLDVDVEFYQLPQPVSAALVSRHNPDSIQTREVKP